MTAKDRTTKATCCSRMCRTRRDRRSLAADGQKILSAIDDLKELLAARHDAEPAPSAVNERHL